MSQLPASNTLLDLTKFTSRKNNGGADILGSSLADNLASLVEAHALRLFPGGDPAKGIGELDPDQVEPNTPERLRGHRSQRYTNAPEPVAAGYVEKE